MTYEYFPIVRQEVNEEKTTVSYYHSGNIGQGFNEHVHEWDHTITCIKGSLKIVEDGQETIIRNGDTFTFQKGIRHSVDVFENGTDFFATHPIPLDHPALQPE